jgi:undecaprenyl-diphosphatase
LLLLKSVKGEFMKKATLASAVFCSFILISLGLTAGWGSEGVLFDSRVLTIIHSSSNSVILTFMKLISFLGSELFLFPAMGIVIIFFLNRKRYFISAMLLSASLGSWLINNLLKQIFQRSRPFDYFLVEQGGLSYPSGHSMVSMSMALTVAYLLSKCYRYSHRTNLLYVSAGLYVALMGSSRLYLGVHWPTDIIGGFAAGYIYFIISTYLIEKLRLKKMKSKALS